MSFIQKIKRIERLDGLIRRKSTGSPRDLASRIEVAESTIYEYIKLMRELGAPIEWDKIRNTYYYTETTQFQFGFTIPNENSLEVQGGINKLSDFFIQLRNF